MPNHLAREQSPYLLQHKDIPVDWLYWEERKPILTQTKTVSRGSSEVSIRRVKVEESRLESRITARATAAI